MEDGSLELMMTPTTRANPGCMTSPEVVRGTCRVDVHTCGAKEARLVSSHTRDALVEIQRLRYCIFSPPIGQPGYLQCIIIAQALS
jgi:hypothetical protein